MLLFLRFLGKNVINLLKVTTLNKVTNLTVPEFVRRNKKQFYYETLHSLCLGSNVPMY